MYATMSQKGFPLRYFYAYISMNVEKCSQAWVDFSKAIYILLFVDTHESAPFVHKYQCKYVLWVHIYVYVHTYFMSANIHVMYGASTISVARNRAFPSTILCLI